MTSKNIKFLNIDNPDWNYEDFLKEYPKVYRFVSMERFLDIIFHNRLFFFNPEEWADPWEKRFLNADYIVKGVHYSLPIKGRIYSLCWTGSYASEAYWNTYIKHNDGVRYSVTSTSLIGFLQTLLSAYSSIESIYVGKVKYDFIKAIAEYEQGLKHNPDFINSLKEKEFNQDQCKLLLFKRNAFQYENEIRVMILFNTSRITSKKGPDNRQFKIDPVHFFDDNIILLDHRMEPLTYVVFKDLIEKTINSPSISVQKSSLTSKKYEKLIIRF